MESIDVLQHLAERVFPNKCVRTLLSRTFAEAKDVKVAVRKNSTRSWVSILTVHYKVRRVTVEGEKYMNRWFVLCHVYTPSADHPNIQAMGTVEQYLDAATALVEQYRSLARLMWADRLARING